MAVRNFRGIFDAMSQVEIVPAGKVQEVLKTLPKMTIKQDDGFDELADPELVEEDERPVKSLGQEIRDELDLVWRAYKYVIASWISLPFKM